MTIAAIVPAAGLSARMGRNKLLEVIAGIPMLRVVAESVLASHARPVVVVVGHEAQAVRGALAGLDVETVENTLYREGLASSIRAGLAAVPQSSEGALIIMGDMPHISPALIDAVIANFAPDKSRAICVAAHRGRLGHPVLFGRQFFPELLALTGDAGAKRIVASHDAVVGVVEADSDAPLADIDTPDALAKLRGAFG